MAEGTDEGSNGRPDRVTGAGKRGKTVHGAPANAGHRVLAPDDAEVNAYLETALKAPGPDRPADIHHPTREPAPGRRSWSSISGASSPS